MVGKMTPIAPCAALILTLMSASEGWSTEVSTAPQPLRSSGIYLGLSGQTLTGPQGDSQMYWGSVQVAWMFGERFAHGPELELGYHQIQGAYDDDEGPSPGSAPRQLVHFGVAYRFTVDVVREAKAALFFGGRLAFGWIPDPGANGGTIGNLYLQTEVCLGIRFALGPAVARVSFGPAVGLYELYGFTSYQAAVAISF